MIEWRSIFSCFAVRQTAIQPNSIALWSHPTIHRFDSLTNGNRRRFLRAVEHVSFMGVLNPLVDPANALTPTEASEAYDLYAADYDTLDGGGLSSMLGLDDAREALLRKARGNVLEIGVGTGLNLSKYDISKLSSLTLVDISDGMIQRARARVESLHLTIPVTFVKADATTELIRLFGPDSFDTVVDSFSLCVMGEEGAKKCMMQMSTVLKPNSGRLLLLENSRSSSSALAMYQDLTANAAAVAGGKGCVYNQDVLAMIIGTQVLKINESSDYLAGLVRSFECTKTDG